MDKEKKTTAKSADKKKYIEAVGRRKTSTARVRITPAPKNTFVVNGKKVSEYFKTTELVAIVNDPFEKTKYAPTFEITVVVSGGGVHSQAEAIRHGISRALVDSDLEIRGRLKQAGFLKRDPRAKERRKFGLKKARKAPQWSKR